MLRTLTALLIVAALFSRCTPPISAAPAKSLGSHSQTQAWIDSLGARLERDYEAAANDVAKQGILNEYHATLHSYLKDSLNYTLDSIRVNVGGIKYNSERSFSTKFNNDNTAYAFDIVFRDDTDLSKDSLYSFIKGLKENTDTTIKFLYFGECTVNAPGGYDKTFEITAIPAPLGMKAQKDEKDK